MTGRQTAAGFGWWAALGGLCAVLLAPLLVVDVPPLLDYPNHLARAFVLASLPGDSVLGRFYAPHWSVIPNLALDLAAPPLMHVLPVDVVGRLLIAAAVLLPVLGAVAYNVALGGRWWSLGAGLVAYNSCLLYGFLNFAIALGLALLLAAGWLRWREDRPARAIVLGIGGAPVLFACHLMGLVFFGLLIGGSELVQVYQGRRAGLFRMAVVRGVALVTVFTVPLVLYIVSDLRHLGGDAAFLPVGRKLLQLVTVFANYDWLLDVAAAGFAVGLPVLCVVVRRGSVPAPALCAMVLLLIGFLAMPYGWKGTFRLDTRFAVMLGLMLFAGFVPARWPVGFRRCVAAVVVVLFVARMGLLGVAWGEHRADLADLRAVLAPVRPGQAVYVAEAGFREAPAYWAANPRWRLLSDGVRMDEHLGALVLIEHRAFWPFEFDDPSQQPMETRAPYRALAERVGSLPDRAAAAVADVCGFDYVLLLGADAVPELPADRFRLAMRSGYAALYTISHCEGVP